MTNVTLARAAATVTPRRIDQTILASDPKRQGNCVAACVASFFGIALDQVPHFIDYGEVWKPDREKPDTIVWWAMLCGFMASRGLWPVDLDGVDQGEPGELLFVAGPSARGVEHQVLYRDGVLWHDPHPSRDGLLKVTEVVAFRPVVAHDHRPTDA